MGLETGTYISDFVITNPQGTDTINEADDHIRLMKRCIKNTFPNLDGIVNSSDEQLNQLVDNDFITMIKENGVEVAKLSGATFTGEVYYTGPTPIAATQLVPKSYVDSTIQSAYPPYPSVPQHIFGRITAAGTIVKGSGNFSVTVSSLGVHNIVFDVGLAVPYVVVIGLASGSEPGYGSSVYASAEGPNGFTIATNDDETGAITSRDYSFILTYYEA